MLEEGEALDVEEVLVNHIVWPVESVSGLSIPLDRMANSFLHGIPHEGILLAIYLNWTIEGKLLIK